MVFRSSNSDFHPCSSDSLRIIFNPAPVSNSNRMAFIVSGQLPTVPSTMYCTDSSVHTTPSLPIAGYLPKYVVQLGIFPSVLAFFPVYISVPFVALSCLLSSIFPPRVSLFRLVNWGFSSSVSLVVSACRNPRRLWIPLVHRRVCIILQWAQFTEE